MKNDLTVDSMLTEVKKNLSKYESLIKECESNPSKKKISEAESSKKKIEQKIKLVKTIIKTEDDSFMLESYEDLKNELNKRLNIVSKKYEDKKEKKNDLFSSSNSHKKEKKSKKEKNDYDDDELNLNNNIKLSIDESSTSLDDDFARSEQKLNDSRGNKLQQELLPGSEAQVLLLFQLLIVVQKAVPLAPVFPAQQRVQLHAVDAVEDVLLHLGVLVVQAGDQPFHRLAAGGALVHGGGLGQSAGAAYEFQAEGVPPGDDVSLANQVQRADQLHAREVGAVHLGHHALQLGAVEHGHDGGLDHVVEVVAQGDLVAAQCPGLAVQVAPAHPGAQVAGVLLGAVGGGEDVGFEDVGRDPQQLQILLDPLPVGLRVAGIHHEKFQLKGHVAVLLQLLQELCQQHGVLAAGDAHGDSVARKNQLVVAYGVHEWAPYGLPILGQQALLDLL